MHTDKTNDPKMRTVGAKVDNKVLTNEQKAKRVTIANEILELVQIEPDYLDSVITGNKT